MLTLLVRTHLLAGSVTLNPLTKMRNLLNISNVLNLPGLRCTKSPRISGAIRDICDAKVAQARNNSKVDAH